MNSLNKFFMAIVVMHTLAACNASPPTCSDEETLDLVREIAFGEEYTKQELQAHVLFATPLATAEQKDIRKISCTATMMVANTYQIPIRYDSQLDDHDQHVVSLGNIGRGDALHLLVALNQAVKKTRAPETEASANADDTVQPEKSAPTQSQSSEVIIPAQFQGDWGRTESCQAWKEHPEAGRAPSPGLSVTATGIHFIEGGCLLATATTASASTFAGAFRCTGDDGETDTTLTEMTLKIDAGKLSTQEAEFIKCQ